MSDKAKGDRVGVRQMLTSEWSAKPIGAALSLSWQTSMDDKLHGVDADRRSSYRGRNAMSSIVIECYIILLPPEVVL